MNEELKEKLEQLGITLSEQECLESGIEIGVSAFRDRRDVGH
jgi:hypothetical protein